MTAQGNPRRIRVLVADDQTLVRAGFRMILEAREDLEVVAEAADGAAAVAAAVAHSPDVVLMDIRMPGVDGLAATRELMERSQASRPRVLVLTTFDLDEYVFEALRAGAAGFLLKDTPPAQLVEAIRVVAAGDALLAPSVTRRLIERFAGLPAPAPRAPAAAPPVPGDLTARETEVFRLVAQGMSNAQIAARLVVSETTVKSHVARLLMKLGVHDRVQAVVLAYETGFVTPGAC